MPVDGNIFVKTVLFDRYLSDADAKVVGPLLDRLKNNERCEQSW